MLMCCFAELGKWSTCAPTAGCRTSCRHRGSWWARSCGCTVSRSLKITKMCKLIRELRQGETWALGLAEKATVQQRFLQREITGEGMTRGTTGQVSLAHGFHRDSVLVGHSGSRHLVSENGQQERLKAGEEESCEVEECEPKWYFDLVGSASWGPTRDDVDSFHLLGLEFWTEIHFTPSRSVSSWTQAAVFTVRAPASTER